MISCDKSAITVKAWAYRPSRLSSVILSCNFKGSGVKSIFPLKPGAFFSVCCVTKVPVICLF